MNIYSVFLFLAGLYFGFQSRDLINSSTVVDFYIANNFKPDRSDHDLTNNNQSDNFHLNLASSENKNIAIVSDNIDSMEIHLGDDLSSIIDSLSRLDGGDYNFYMQRNFEIVNLLNKNNDALYQMQSLYVNSNRDSDFQGDLKEVILKLDKERIDIISNYLINSYMEENQILGLELIADYQNSSIDDYNVVYQILSEHQVSREVLLTSLRSIPAIPTSIEKKRGTLDVLEEYVVSGDAEVRFESILAMGRLANHVDQLDPILTLPQTEENKIMTVLAIEGNNMVDSELKNILISYAFDENNSQEIRAMAMESLTRFDLNISEKNTLGNIIDSNGQSR